MDAFSSYVFSEMPAHLIYVPEMRLVDRNDVFNTYKHIVETITEEDVERFSGYWPREEAIRKVLRHKIKFAAFSHCWLGTGEPTFQDMSEPRKDMSKKQAGYQKLTNFCKRALEYECDLAWSDTCCINKESSAELEEAIQAMFNWYRTSAICIAYLACSSSVTDFAQERWFTRGWTLQELLAPEKMKFYGRNWEPLSDERDDKHPVTTPGAEGSIPVTSSQPDVLTAVTRLTEIEDYDLTRFDPGIFRVQQRLRWASRRTTTRIEDMAYCLIGIFDVSMPITYGEGQRSWFRFMEIILQRCKSWDVFAWAGPWSPYSCAIPSSPKGYSALDVSSFIELRRSLDMGKLEGKVGQTPTNLRGDHAFTMTRHGLQMKMPLLPVVFDRTKQDVTIHAWIPGSYIRWSKPQDITVQVVCRQWVPQAEKYCVGLVNYNVGGLARSNTQYEICEGPLLCYFFTLPPNDHSWLRLQTENVVIIDHKGPPVRCECSFETIYFYGR